MRFARCADVGTWLGRLTRFVSWNRPALANFRTDALRIAVATATRALRRGYLVPAGNSPRAALGAATCLPRATEHLFGMSQLR